MMKFILSFLFVAFASAKCPNDCSGHGACNVYSACECYRNWMGNDCSERVCYFGRAFVDTPEGDLNTDGFVSTTTYGHRSANQEVAEAYPQYAGWGSRTYKLQYDGSVAQKIQANTAGSARGEAHFYKECSNKGICNRGTGLCECFPGYAGEGCSRTACANDCSGHGVCQRIADTTPNYRGWDMYSTQECVCDPGYFGSDCSLRKCPKGDDPVTKYVGYTKITFKDRSATGNENSWFDSSCLTTGFCAEYPDADGSNNQFHPTTYHTDVTDSASCTAITNAVWHDMTDARIGVTHKVVALRNARARARMYDYFGNHSNTASTQADVRVWNHGGSIGGLPDSLPRFKGCLICMACTGITLSATLDPKTRVECDVAGGNWGKVDGVTSRDECNSKPGQTWTPFHKSEATAGTLHSFNLGSAAHSEAACTAVGDATNPTRWEYLTGLELEQYFRCDAGDAAAFSSLDFGTDSNVTGWAEDDAKEDAYSCENAGGKWKLFLHSVDEGMSNAEFQGFSWNPWYSRGGGSPPPSVTDVVEIGEGNASTVAAGQSSADFASKSTSGGVTDYTGTQYVTAAFKKANPYTDLCKNGSSTGMGSESCMNTAIEYTTNPGTNGYSLHRMNALSNYKMVATGKSSHATGVLSGAGCAGPDDDGTQCNDLDFWSMYLKDVSGEFQVGDTINVKGYGLVYRCSDSTVPDSADREDLARRCNHAFSAGVGSGGEANNVYSSQLNMDAALLKQQGAYDATNAFTLHDAQYPSSTVSFNYDLCNYISDISTYYSSGSASGKSQRDEVQVLTIKFQKIDPENCSSESADGTSRKFNGCGGTSTAGAETAMGGHFAIEFEDEMGDTWMTKSIPVTSHSSRQNGVQGGTYHGSQFDIYPMDTTVFSAGSGQPTVDATATIATLIEQALEELPNGVVGDVQVSSLNDTYDAYSCCVHTAEGECKEDNTDQANVYYKKDDGSNCSDAAETKVSLKSLGRMDTERSYAITFLENSGNLPKLKVAYSLTDKEAGAIQASANDTSRPYTQEGNYKNPGTTYTGYTNAGCGGGSASNCLSDVSGVSDFPVVETTASDADNKSKVFIQDTSFRAFPSYNPNKAEGNDGSKENIECSNRGICDYTTGLCQCFTGFTDADCSKQNALSIGA